MPKLVWSRQALLDIQRLYRFLAASNPDAAKRGVNAIRTGVKTIKQFPQSGRLVDDIDIAYRDWLIPFGDIGYVARYWYDGKNVEILSVRHQRELP